jgi:hypothetical protein
MGWWYVSGGEVICDFSRVQESLLPHIFQKVRSEQEMQFLLSIIECGLEKQQEYKFQWSKLTTIHVFLL